MTTGALLDRLQGMVPTVQANFNNGLRNEENGALVEQNAREGVAVGRSRTGGIGKKYVERRTVFSRELAIGHRLVRDRAHEVASDA